MNTSIRKLQKAEKKIGRPVSTGAAAAAPRSIRLPPDIWERIDAWRRLQPGELLSRNEAIRRLVEQALDSAGNSSGRPRPGGAR